MRSSQPTLELFFFYLQVVQKKPQLVSANSSNRPLPIGLCNLCIMQHTSLIAIVDCSSRPVNFTKTVKVSGWGSTLNSNSVGPVIPALFSHLSSFTSNTPDHDLVFNSSADDALQDFLVSQYSLLTVASYHG